MLPEHRQIHWWVQGVQRNNIEVFSQFCSFLTIFHLFCREYSIRKNRGHVYLSRRIYSTLYSISLVIVKPAGMRGSSAGNSTPWLPWSSSRIQITAVMHHCTQNNLGSGPCQKVNPVMPCLTTKRDIQMQNILLNIPGLEFSVLILDLSQFH